MRIYFAFSAISRLSFFCAASAMMLFASTTLGAAEAQPAASPVDFSRDIRPLLSDRCFHCHGPDEKDRKGGFRLDQKKSAFGEAESGEHPIVAGKPEASELVRRITADDPDERMPPAESNKKLSAAEIELLRRWVREGAVWQDHWAFTAPTQPALPAVKDAHWGRNEIDRFVLARLERQRLHPSAEANRETLIRRLSLDLVGLPPTLADIDAFVQDKSDNAYEKLVDRLLASPHYGERMAVEWLDGARFADTNGFQNDFVRDMSPWRDWTIKAFNDNMPYNQFVIEQLAGDMLPNATLSQKVATGFCRNNRTVTEAGSIAEEWRVENIVDRVETVSGVFLGLTMGCARCHDHKYDPISQREFYQFYGFFNSTADAGFYQETRGNTGPMVRVMQPEQEKQLAELDAAVAKAERATQAIAGASEAEFAAWRKQLQAKPATDPQPSLQMPLDGDLVIKTSQPRPGNGPAATTTAKTRFAAGIAGQSLELAGTPQSHVSLGSALAFERDVPFTLTCWVRPEGEGALWSKMDDQGAFRGVDAYMAGDGRLSVHLIHHWSDNALKVISHAKLRLGQWNHVCVTYDGSSKAAGVNIFLDGRASPLEVEVDKLNGSIATPQPFRLGRRSTSLFFKGGLSDFRHYDRALTTPEVETLLHASLARAATATGPANTQRLKALRPFYETQDGGSHGAANRELARLRREKDEFLKKTPMPTVMVLQEMPKPRPTYPLKRGQYDAPDKEKPLAPAVPAYLPPLRDGAKPDRLALAQWIVDPANPLTARVAVNRLWQRFFGHGLVRTPDNFGFQGEAPTHPELLDWLATELVRRNWNIKAMQKLIVTSAAYRQSSSLTDQLVQHDPENRLLARGPRYRLQAEVIRDNALALGGLLSTKIGGPSVKPYQPAGLWEELAGGANNGPYKRDSGESLYRRSLYTYRKRTVPHSTTSTFDAPSWEICTIKRSRTNTPLQALALLNDETYVEAARGLAQRMMREGGASVDDRVRHGFRLATGRMPTASELQQLAGAYQRYLKVYADEPAAGAALLTVGEAKPDEKLDKSQLAAYATVASIILNLDETISKE